MTSVGLAQARPNDKCGARSGSPQLPRVLFMGCTGASQLRSLGTVDKMRSSYQLHLGVRILITTLLLLCAVEGK